VQTATSKQQFLKGQSDTRAQTAPLLLDAPEPHPGRVWEEKGDVSEATIVFVEAASKQHADDRVWDKSLVNPIVAETTECTPKTPKRSNRIADDTRGVWLMPKIETGTYLGIEGVIWELVASCLSLRGGAGMSRL